MTTFKDLDLSNQLYNSIEELGFVNPTPIQEASYSVVRSGKDIVGIAQTGTGKTLMAKTIAKMLNVPLAIVDATVLTEAGYVGEDVESILAKLLQAADFDVSAAERGIVFIDEIDKIARKSDNPSITRDVSGEGVQQAMLKLLEGAEIGVPPKGGRKHPEQKLVTINTKNILFVTGGAFVGIDKLISSRLNTSAVGYASKTKRVSKVDSDNMFQYVTPQDLKKFGLIPELIGRMPIVTYLKPLDKKSISNALAPDSAVLSFANKTFSVGLYVDLLLSYICQFFVPPAVPLVYFKITREGANEV